MAAALVAASLAAVNDSGANPPLAGLQQIAPGGAHTCAVTSAGGVQCWGANGYGQLGNGTFTSAAAAVDVAGLASGVVAVTTGGQHSCALMISGRVKCWGHNDQGQAGIPASPPHYTWVAYPAEVPGLADVTAIAAGSAHTCALTAAGTMKCWGNNYYGQLGNGSSQTGGPAIVDVANLSGVVAIATGWVHTCAVTSQGAARCWGYNGAGQLGTGTTQNASLPSQVSALASGVQGIVAGGNHSCALRTGGGVKCWGDNGAGQLGDGSTASASTPVDATLAAPAVMLAVGSGHSCALLQGGSVHCWGASPGNGRDAGIVLPTPVGALGSGVRAIASSVGHTCALVDGGVALCWGFNSSGELGDGTAPHVPAPVDVLISEEVVQVAAGEDHACALLAGGVVKCWGRNVRGQLGNGDTKDAFAPVDVALGASGVAIRAGGYSSCAITSTGAVKCWGDLGPAPQSLPQEIGSLAGSTDVALGSNHACALLGNGTVRCWGDNSYGQLGDGSTNSAVAPVAVVGLGQPAVALGLGKFHSCAVLADGAIRCWGDDTAGQVSSVRGGLHTAPIAVPGLGEPALAVDGGDAHTCARTTAQAMRCWGLNNQAQFGLGYPHDGSAVTTVPLATPTLRIAAGARHSCQLDTVGTLRCWGANESGQAGRQTRSLVMSPAPVLGAAGASAVSASGNFTCALVGGGVKCWGQNFYGQLGIGVGGYRIVPAPVVASLCGDFDDVVAGNPFCGNVEWIRNRSITQGCTAERFCPDGVVSRMTMAAFMNRVATALTPVHVAREEQVGPLAGTTAVVCTTGDVAFATLRRRVHLDAVIRATAPADVPIAIEPSWSVDGGLTWSRWNSHHVGVRAQRWANFRVVSDFDLVGENVDIRFALRLFAPLSGPGSLDLAQVSCNLRVRLDNLNGPAPPL